VRSKHTPLRVPCVKAQHGGGVFAYLQHLGPASQEIRNRQRSNSLMLMVN
jgi:hypothetical protein